VIFEKGEAIDDAIRHMYSSDLMFGWGIHVVQEVMLSQCHRRDSLTAVVLSRRSMKLSEERQRWCCHRRIHEEKGHPPRPSNIVASSL